MVGADIGRDHFFLRAPNLRVPRLRPGPRPTPAKAGGQQRFSSYSGLRELNQFSLGPDMRRDRSGPRPSPGTTEMFHPTNAKKEGNIGLHVKTAPRLRCWSMYGL